MQHADVRLNDLLIYTHLKFQLYVFTMYASFLSSLYEARVWKELYFLESIIQCLFNLYWLFS
jgi:hypothetical protein